MLFFSRQISLLFSATSDIGIIDKSMTAVFAGSTEWHESSTFHPAAEWTGPRPSPRCGSRPRGRHTWCPGQWSPVATPGTKSGYNNLHITVEYHILESRSQVGECEV